MSPWLLWQGSLWGWRNRRNKATFRLRVMERMARKRVAHLTKSVFGSDFKGGNETAMKGRLVPPVPLKLSIF